MANMYFEAIENNDGKGHYPFTSDCDRLENGTLTTRTPGMIRMGGIDVGAMGCREQFETGLYGVVIEVHHRRFPIVNEERQAVMAFAVFDHCGCKRELVMPDCTVVPIAGFTRRSSILLAEAFRIDAGLIAQVEAGRHQRALSYADGVVIGARYHFPTRAFLHKNPDSRSFSHGGSES